MKQSITAGESLSSICQSKLNVKVIKAQYARAPTSAIKRDVNE